MADLLLTAERKRMQSLAFGMWSFDPSVVAGCAGAAIAYVALCTWLAPRFGRPSGSSQLFFWLGLGLLIVALESPIDRLGDHYLFSAHMVQHMVLAMVVPAFMMASLPDAMLVPVRVPAHYMSIMFSVVLLAWHVPFVYETTLRDEPVHITEHIAFLAAGAAVLWPVTAHARGRIQLNRRTAWSLVATANVPAATLGLLLLLWPAPLYSSYILSAQALGVSAQEDQQLGGAVMLCASAVSYAVGLALAWRTPVQFSGPVRSPGPSTPVAD